MYCRYLYATLRCQSLPKGRVGLSGLDGSELDNLSSSTDIVS